MIRNRIFLKTLAILLIIEIVGNTVWPTVSYALTSGPTAPEATSFEPVDTTDLVNTLNGDFTYNMPLLEVPSPSGGYPLSLAYHAGIQPNEDASWTGLGWNLNPGAINRSVNGYADDFSNVLGRSRTFWEGGVSKSFNVQVSVGSAQMAPTTVGISVSEDTYQGVTQTAFLQIGSTSFTASQSRDDVGSRSSYGATTGIGLGNGYSLAASMESGKGGAANLGYPSDLEAISNMDFSLENVKSALQSKAFAAVGLKGASMSSGSAKKGAVRTRSRGFSLTIPLLPFGISVSVGSSYRRYWIDEKETTNAYGALYSPLSTANFDNAAFDVYNMQAVENMVNRSAEERMHGAFINYDNYNVLAQGVVGAIRPYHYKAFLFQKNVKEKEGSTRYRMKTYPLGENAHRPTFRFMGDFSNRYLYPDVSNDFLVDKSSTSPIAFQFDDSELTGENGDDGFDPEQNLLYGSRDVQWFSNAEVISGVAVARGLAMPVAPGFVRDDDEKIGAFIVTNPDGVRYHYALPVYTSEEGSYSGRKDHKGKHSFNKLSNPEKYAYTWLLTAVVGPDYVDANHNGFADNGDFGYWVTFEYGKWTDRYNWRNPSEGFEKDVDRSFNNFSKGKKEVYYLNTARTQTHTAVFVKELRLDGKSVVPEIDGVIKTSGNHNVEDIDHGGFDPKTKTYRYGGSDYPYTEHPVSSLALTDIYLFQNEVLNSILGVNDLSSSSTVYQQTHQARTQAPTLSITYHQGNNIVDVFDVATYGDDFGTKSLKHVKLNYSYLLAPKTANSFKSVVDVLNTQETADPTLSGKLTLESVQFFSKGNNSLMPATKFYYDIDKKFTGSISGQGNSRFVAVPLFEQMDFKLGDVVLIGGSCYAYIREIDEANNKLGVEIIDGSLPSAGLSNVEIRLTKNPPYLKDHYDLWGLFKADYSSAIQDETSSRMTTSTSRNSLDVWSMRRIKTPLGAEIEINFEPDKYDNALKSLMNIPIKSMVEEGDNLRITLYERVEEYDLHAGDEVALSAVMRTKFRAESCWGSSLDSYCFTCSSRMDHVYQWQYTSTLKSPDPTTPILSVDQNSFVVAGVLGYSKLYKYGIKFQAMREPPFTVKDFGSVLEPNHILVWPEVPEFAGGEVIFDNPVYAPYGGGIRVASITLKNGQDSKTTRYEYFNGVTTYEPSGYSVPISRVTSEQLQNCLLDLESAAIEQYRYETFLNFTYKRFLNLFVNARHIPAPGVNYGRVRVTEDVVVDGVPVGIPGAVEYEYEVFSPALANIHDANSIAYHLVNSSSFLPGNIPIQLPPEEVVPDNVPNPVLGLDITDVQITDRSFIDDFSALYGQLKRVTYFNKNGEKLTETINHFLHDGKTIQQYRDALPAYKSQGVITESFANARIIINGNGEATSSSKYSLYGMLNQQTFHPAVSLGQTQIDYKTGITTSSWNARYDFYSGMTVSSWQTDEYGNKFVTETVPAYTVYPLMGFRAAGGYNMLTQEASSMTYKVSNTNVPIGLVSANVQTWSDKSTIFDHPELSASVVLSTFGLAEDGINSATSPETSTHLFETDRVEFFHNGVKYQALVEEAELKQNQHYWEYKIRILGDAAPGTSLSNLTVTKLTAWRKYSSYAYIGDDNQPLLPDGLHALEDNQLPAFTAWNPGDPTPAGWQKNAEITLYDVYSHALEAKDLNGQFAATKMTPDQTRVSATVANARYHEFTYSGAEEGSVGNLVLGNGVTIGTGGAWVDELWHTGSSSVVTSNQGFFTETDVTPGKKYTVSVWATKSSATLKWVDGTGTTGVDVMLQPKRQAGDWYLLTGVVQPTQTHMKIWSQANGEETHFDDFRFHPFDAAMMCYVYNNWGELSHILDNNNLYTAYRYDGMGRLTSTYKETFMRPQEEDTYGINGIVKVSEVNYNYGANNPFMLPLTFSVSGTTGNVQYSGLPQVQQRKSFTFEIKENCATPKFASLMIDNQLINTAISTHTLLDGTIVKVNGRVVTLENVISPHTIYVNFNDFTNTGWARCGTTPRINQYGNTVYCRDGSFEYWYYNACGEEQTHLRTYDINNVPEALRVHLPGGGCAPEEGTNCAGDQQQ